MASKDEFMKYVVERQAKQQEQKDKEVLAYFKQTFNKRRCSWGVSFGGYRY